jgi:hypothetical protein
MVNKKYKILTPEGWKPFDGIRKIVGKKTIKITFENNKEIICTEDHKIYKNLFECVEAKDLKVKDYILTVDGMTSITSIKENGVEDVYDILEVAGENRFYANNILVHNCEFIGQSNSLIDTAVIRNLLLDLENVSYKFVVDSDIRFYKDLEPYKKYIVSLDTSMGVEGDFAAIQVFEFPTFIQVAEWQSDKLNQNLQVEKIKTLVDWMFADIKNKGNRHPEIYWSLENNGSGEGFICALREKGGPEYIKRGILINERGNKRIGFTTSKTTKPAACSQLKILIETNKMKILSREYAVQLSNFSAKSAVSYSATGTSHDDLISSSLIMLMIYLQEKNRLDLNLEIYNNKDNQDEKKIKIDEVPIIFSIN